MVIGAPGFSPLVPVEPASSIRLRPIRLATVPRNIGTLPRTMVSLVPPFANSIAWQRESFRAGAWAGADSESHASIFAIHGTRMISRSSAQPKQFPLLYDVSPADP